MKKKWLALLLTVTFIVACALGLTACIKDEPTGSPEHEHTYSTEWSSNSDNHYHVCTDADCDSVKDSEAHQYGEWETVTAATVDENGREKKVCSVCGYAEYRDTDKLTPEPPHSHNWGEWTITEENMPTENADGKVTRTCTADDCGEVDTLTLTVPQLMIDGAINPAYDDLVTNNTADCENDGTATYTYLNAQYEVSLSFTGKTPALGHDWKETLDYDEDYHYIVCNRNAEHIKPDSKETHNKNTTETPRLKYNKQTGKWEQIYHSTCEDHCGYAIDFKDEDGDLNDGGDGVSLTYTSFGSGTQASPFIISASNTIVFTVTIPSNTVVSLRYTNSNAMGVYAVAVTEGNNLSVIFGERVVAVAEGERAKSDPYLGGANSLDFAFTSTNGEATTVKFKFFDNANYYIAGTPAMVEEGNEYTDEVPEETDIVHTFEPASDGMYTFTVTGGEILLENGHDLVSAGSSFTEPLYFGKSYKITVYTGLDRHAGTVKFIIERAGDIPEPADGSISKPEKITETGEYTISGSRFFAFTPSQNGFYVFCDKNSSTATYSLNSDSYFASQIIGSIHFNNMKEYSYIEYELSAGTTYYLYVSSGSEAPLNMTISIHDHTFNTEEWQSDSNSHWNLSTCGHNVKGNLGGHEYDDNNICKVCHYEKEELVTEGLAFDLSSDGTYYIVSAGTITNDVTEIHIPSTYGESGSKLPIKEIKASGFASKAFVTSVSIPSSITKIGLNAFQYCTSITDIYITDLNAWAQITFGNNASSPFYASQYLEGMRSTNTTLYLNGAPLSDIELNVPVSNYAFMNCASILSVSLSGESVGMYAFAYCDALKNLTLNDGVQTIGNNAFLCCAKIKELTFPATLTTVGTGAFGAQTRPVIDGPAINKLTVVDLAGYLQTDWSAALLASGGKLYVGENEVTSINAAELGINKIGNYALQNSSVASVNLTGVTSLGTSAFKDSKVTRVDIDSISSWLNITFDNNSNPLSATDAKLYVNNEEVTSLTLSGVVQDSAFYGYKALTSVDLSGVTEIGSSAFYGTGITSVVIGSNTTKIGTGAFYGCTSLITVTINGNITSIGSTTFRNCSQLTTVIIGEGVTSIAANAFNSCSSLTTLVLPKSLATLTNTALTGCTSLTKIYFLGTSEEDLKQEDGTTAKTWTTVANVKSKTIYFYSEEEPTTEGNFWHYVEGVPTAYPAVEVAE